MDKGCSRQTEVEETEIERLGPQLTEIDSGKVLQNQDMEFTLVVC